MVVTGTCLRSSHEAVRLCASFAPSLYSTAGIHPHDAKSFDERAVVELEQLSQQPAVVAIGECGLDFNRDFSPRPMQRSCFAAQLDLAAKTSLPVFMHERDAHDEFVDSVAQRRSKLSNGVVHCFTGTYEQASAYLDLDLHLGITGWICDERRGMHLREVVQKIPVDRLMIETDAPYLAPRDIRPKISRNEPKHLPHILKTVADSRGEPVEQLADQLMLTTKRFFNIVETPSSND